MSKLNYWEDTAYKEAIKNYSEYERMCRSLNQFSPEDQWCFDKRDIYLKKANDIKEKLVNS